MLNDSMTQRYNYHEEDGLYEDGHAESEEGHYLIDNNSL